MDSPRTGFRRATATSWALVGVGIAGVAGASALAYADTFKPPKAEAPFVAVDPAPPELGPTPALDVPAASDPVATPTDPVPPMAPETTAALAPVTSEIPAPVYTPQYTPEYAPRQTYEPSPAPVTHESQAPTTPPTTKRRNLTPTTVMAPNFSPHVSVSRGS
jgi:protein TonB